MWLKAAKNVYGFKGIMLNSGDIMSNEENKVTEEELDQIIEEAEAQEVEAELEEIGDETDAKIAQLEAALLSSEEKVKEQQDAVLRSKAEVENMRRRTEQEIDKARKFALNKFAEELLPVIDNLERAIQAADIENETVKPFLEGVELTHKVKCSTQTSIKRCRFRKALIMSQIP